MVGKLFKMVYHVFKPVLVPSFLMKKLMDFPHKPRGQLEGQERDCKIQGGVLQSSTLNDLWPPSSGWCYDVLWLQGGFVPPIRNDLPQNQAIKNG